MFYFMLDDCEIKLLIVYYLDKELADYNEDIRRNPGQNMHYFLTSLQKDALRKVNPAMLKKFAKSYESARHDPAVSIYFNNHVFFK